ncbi:hypothetical protein ASPZODRAFT_162625 [Penicilliopsis zonata CBS 506.65]|uniref:Uncharacterized protein n=1 Tax=Penicilliopsis zonata CBS 506.65 TaxID=1073090 RepID=A0A1L9STY9_9EURO|nr:hypothetical protein ASPZODRAFT_162625 [Penicilliopsis zonata CBS 506.65]OJJ50685.1 hypothetical protein ASPZODRAFT_162625 [Penicilliopsis zonata CBS 506.65]
MMNLHDLSISDVLGMIAVGVFISKNFPSGGEEGRGLLGLSLTMQLKQSPGIRSVSTTFDSGRAAQGRELTGDTAVPPSPWFIESHMLTPLRPSLASSFTPRGGLLSCIQTLTKTPTRHEQTCHGVASVGRLIRSHVPTPTATSPCLRTPRGNTTISGSTTPAYPETQCGNINLTLDFTLSKYASQGSPDAPANLVLTDRGGFANLDHEYPEWDRSDPQNRPEPEQRAYKAAWSNNAYSINREFRHHLPYAIPAILTPFCVLVVMSMLLAL